MLDMVGEKVTEVHFANQITSFFEQKGLELIDYTACESIYFKKFENYDEIFKGKNSPLKISVVILQQIYYKNKHFLVTLFKHV